MGDRLVDLPHRLAHQRCHLRDSWIRRAGHDLRLVDEIARPVQDPVDAAREREHVLGLQRGDEGCAERAQQLSLRGVGSVLGIAHCFGRRGLPAGPGREGVEPLDRHRDLVAQEAEHVWRLGQEPARMRHASHRTSPNKAVARTAVTGMVTSQARPIWRTTAQCT